MSISSPASEVVCSHIFLIPAKIIYMVELLECRSLWAASSLERQMVGDVNSARANPVGACAEVGVDLNEGLPAGYISPDSKRVLVWDERLGNSSRKYAALLLSRGVLTHELDGTTPISRAKVEGVVASVILENAGVTFSGAVWSNPDIILHHQHLAYVAHAGHRAQLFDPRTSNIGVGVAVGMWGSSPALVSVVTFSSMPSRPPPRLFYRPGPIDPPTVLE